MNVIYFDYGGSHSSVVAANIHTGKLDSQETPPIMDIVNLPYFDKTKQDDFGKIRLVGTDAEGNKIYVLGTKNGNSGGLLTSLVEAQNLTNKFRFVDTMPYVNTWLRIGIENAYPELKTMVREAGKTRLMEVLQ